MSADYWQLTLPLPADVSEGLTNFVWELGALGVVEDRELRAFFAPDSVPHALQERASAYLESLRRLGFSVDGEPTVTPVTEEPWAEAWKAYFTPIAVGAGLLIVPPWVAADADHLAAAEPPRGGDTARRPRTTIVIDPGRAFGTGHHGSTAGCLVLLERALHRGPVVRAIDVGTGSGILAIAAAHLGVDDVLGIDNDPDAITNAAANAMRNGVADRVQYTVADVAAVPPGAPAPLLLANLLTSAHLRLARHYRDLVADAGILIAGGILEQEAATVTGALVAAGFGATDAVVVDGWVGLAVTAR